MNIEELIEELTKSGIPVIIVEVRLTPEEREWQKEIEKEVLEYIMNIEEAHKRAANSTLHIGASQGTEYNSVPY